MRSSLGIQFYQLSSKAFEGLQNKCKTTVTLLHENVSVLLSSSISKQIKWQMLKKILNNVSVNQQYVLLGWKR